MDKNREFAELVGVCWHEPDFKTGRCKKCDIGLAIPWGTTYCGIKNPDFSDPRLVLREMMKREDWREFNESLEYPLGHSTPRGCIPIDYILDTTGKLRGKAIEWMKNVDTGA